MTGKNLPAPSKVAGFLARVQQATPAVRPTGTLPASGPARLVIAMDSTASREPSWGAARRVMGEMFKEVPEGLTVQLAWYGGDRFRHSAWTANARALLDVATRVHCEAGTTQVIRSLGHVSEEAAQGGRVAALVLVGDAFEENLPQAEAAARRLRLLGTPVFCFQEGDNTAATRAFGSIADITRGAHVPFDSASPDKLRDLLAGIAAYAQGGLTALEGVAKRLPGAMLLLGHMRPHDGA